MDKIEDKQLLIDEEFSPILVEREVMAFTPILKSFVTAYVDNKDKPIETWLSKELKINLPEKSDEEINNITTEIISNIQVNEKYKNSLDNAVSKGRRKESWFASEIKKGTANERTLETVKYLEDIDIAVSNANESLYRTITTQSGLINQNPNLDGFIAEQYHAQTFNMNAKEAGSEYRAEVLQPEGSVYTKNSVDIVIKDVKGNIVRRYQSKYCKDAESTLKAFEKGDYRGQQKLIPLDQKDGITKKSAVCIEAPDGTKSNALTKSNAQQMRDEAQSGKWNELNWNEYKTKDLAMGVAKKVAQGALISMGISAGYELVQKVWNKVLHKEKINVEEVIENSLNSGLDTGVKAAAAGALKVGVEKGVITAIPKGTSAGILANIAYVGIEVAKDLYGIASGRLSYKEGMEKIEETVVSTTAGLVTMGKGAAIGTAVGMVFGPIGSCVGSCIGGTIGYMAGSKVGQAIVKTKRKIQDVARKVITTVGSGVKAVGKVISTTISNICSKIASVF